MKPQPKLHVKTGRWNADRAAFTLIELLVVFAVIAILAAMTIALISYVNAKALRDRTLVETKSIIMALERYRGDVGDYPTNSLTQTNILARLLGTTTNTGGRVYLPLNKSQISGSALLDPYGNPYGYVYYAVETNGLYNPTGFDLYSTTGKRGSPHVTTNQAIYQMGLTTATDTVNAEWITNWKR